MCLVRVLHINQLFPQLILYRTVLGVICCILCLINFLGHYWMFFYIIHWFRLIHIETWDIWSIRLVLKQIRYVQRWIFLCLKLLPFEYKFVTPIETSLNPTIVFMPTNIFMASCLATDLSCTREFSFCLYVHIQQTLL